MYVCMCTICVYIYIYTYTPLSLSIYIYIHIFMCICIERERERYTHVIIHVHLCGSSGVLLTFQEHPRRFFKCFVILSNVSVYVLLLVFECATDTTDAHWFLEVAQAEAASGSTPTSPEAAAHSRSCIIRKGIRRQGVGCFCKDCLCFDTMPCRHMPLLVHFWTPSPSCVRLTSLRARRTLGVSSSEIRSDELGGILLN